MNDDRKRIAAASVFLRSFLIQGSWNYKTMLGTGFGFALVPALKKLVEGDPDALSASLSRHVGHFNAHPYLANVALGATVRLEQDGEDPDTVARFKTAVRGPLGGLGDSLVWATWLPMVSMAALTLYWLGLDGPRAVVCFLALYNVGHLGLRVWAFRVGLREGRGVGGRLAAIGLATWATKLRPVAVLVLGALAGALLAGDGGLVDSGRAWTALAAAGFGGGLLVGHRLWRPAAVTVVGAVGALAIWGIIR